MAYVSLVGTCVRVRICVVYSLYLCRRMRHCAHLLPVQLLLPLDIRACKHTYFHRLRLLFTSTSSHPSPKLAQFDSYSQQVRCLIGSYRFRSPASNLCWRIDSRVCICDCICGICTCVTVKCYILCVSYVYIMGSI